MTGDVALLLLALFVGAVVGGAWLALRRRRRDAQRRYAARRRAQDAAAWQRSLDKANPGGDRGAGIRVPAAALDTPASVRDDVRRSPWSER